MTPGYYWVLHSPAYRADVEKVRANSGVNPLEWETRPFIAQWGTLAANPEPDEWGWLIPGDDSPYESATDLVIVAGPLQPPEPDALPDTPESTTHRDVT